MEITPNNVIAVCFVAVVVINGLFSESNYNGKVLRWLYKISFAIMAGKGAWLMCQMVGLVAS